MIAGRVFSIFYALLAVLFGVIKFSSPDPAPWLIVCASAAIIGLWSAVRRPPTLICAAHAGLTATWAGTLAPKALFTAGPYVQPETFFELIGLCAGMTVLI